MGVYRGCTLNVHAELEYLSKWFPPRGYPGRWPRDLKLAKLFKEWSKTATQQCGLKHRERRAYLLGELEVCRGLLDAVPGLAAPKAPLALAAAALARDELLWALRHAPDRGAAALPPKYSPSGNRRCRLLPGAARGRRWPLLPGATVRRSEK